MKKQLIWGVILIGVLYVAFWSFNSYIYNEKQAGSTVENNQSGEAVVPERRTITGEYVCLPHRDKTGPQTMECTFGLKSDTGEHYSLDFMLSSRLAPDLNVGDRLTVSGVFTPLERLSADFWYRYDIVGIISVTDFSLGNLEPELM